MTKRSAASVEEEKRILQEKMDALNRDFGADARKKKVEEREEYPGLSESMKVGSLQKVQEGRGRRRHVLPRAQVQAGTIVIHLCGECARFGRTLAAMDLPGEKNRVVVPFCPSCAKMNSVCSRSRFYGTVVKDLVDKEEKAVEEIMGSS